MVLAALITLPAIWWLLRLTPPSPRSVVFPPTRLLTGLADSDQTSAPSPWWLPALRLALAPLLIGALAGPVLNPDRDALPGSGPVVLVVDNGWAAASQWRARQALIEAYISRAERDSRPVMIIGTAGSRDARLETMGPQKAREAAASLQPLPYNPDRARLGTRLKRELEKKGTLSVVWLTDGLDYGGAEAFADSLDGLSDGEAHLTIASPETGASALGVRAGPGSKGTLVAEILRADSDARACVVRAFTARGDQ